MRQAIDEGVAGVIASVASLVTGAANEGGFKGLAGRFARNGLLRFGVPMRDEIRFTRLDTGRSVELPHRPLAVPRPAAWSELLALEIAMAWNGVGSSSSPDRSAGACPASDADRRREAVCDCFRE